MAVFNAVFTGGFNSNLSVNTLRNSPKHYSFTKAERFPSVSIQNAPKYTNYPTFVSARYSTQGFGERIFLKELPGSISPPPTQYKMGSQFESKDYLTGKTFGIGRDFYKNVFVSGINAMAPVNQDQIPGPGQYKKQDLDKLGDNSVKISIKSRIPPCISGIKDFPAPDNYHLKRTLVEANRFSGIGFGYGGRGSPSGFQSNSFISVYHLRSNHYSRSRNL